MMHSPITAAPALDPVLVRHMADYLAARAIHDDFYEAVYKPAAAAWRAAREAVPHYTTKASFQSVGCGTLHMTTERSVDVSIARDRKEHPLKSQSDDFTACVDELIEALDKRDAALAEIDRYSPVDQLGEELDKLGDVSSGHLDLIEAFPASTIGDMIAKLEFIREFLGDEAEIPKIVEDLSRIASAA